MTAGELSCEIPVVVSNHPDLEHVAAQFGVPFRWLPLDRTQGGKPAQEAALEAVLRELDIDTIVLARYMQVSDPVGLGRSEWQSRFCCRPCQHPNIMKYACAARRSSAMTSARGMPIT